MVVVISVQESVGSEFDYFIQIQKRNNVNQICTQLKNKLSAEISGSVIPKLSVKNAYFYNKSGHLQTQPECFRNTQGCSTQSVSLKQNQSLMSRDMQK
jgi:hypothetical protein